MTERSNNRLFTERISTIDLTEPERMNGEIRDREKVMRGLKKQNTPIIKGYQIYHNYLRPHMSLDGKTPSDMAGIKIEGDNRWITLIQNASKRDLNHI